MAYCRASFTTPLPIDAVYDYLADFSNAADWDPGVTDARCITEGPLAEGSRFHVDFRFLGREVPLAYTLVQAQRPHRIVFEGGGERFQSIDTLTLERRADGTRVTYDAQLVLPGWWYLADGPLHLAFQFIGREAIRGLEDALEARFHEMQRAA